jgi:hypothetical protein
MVLNMKHLLVLIKSLIIFPFVILFWHTPSMMRAPHVVEMKALFLLSGLIFNLALYPSITLFFNFIETTNSWLYVGLFLVVLFVITFKQTAKHMEQDAEDDARCEAARLENQKNNPWKPYIGGKVTGLVNIELNDGKILWRVPSGKLEELASEVRSWMPAPRKHV